MLARLITLTSAVLLGLATAPTYANHGVAEVTCTTTYRNGVGSATAPATCVVRGVVHGQVYSNSTITMSYSVNSPASACPFMSTASGSLGLFSFTWSRVGQAAVVSTSGGINGNGTVVFSQTSPVAGSCGGMVTEQFVMTVAGG